jgi:CBS domain-containing protein
MTTDDQDLNGRVPDPVGGLPVSALVGDTVVRVPPGATLRDAAEALAENDVGALVVGEGDEIDAVVSERDVLRAVAVGRDPDATRAVDVGTTELVWVDIDATVAETAQRMMTEYVRHVLLRVDDRLAGIVSARDLLGVFATSEPDPDEAD